MAMTAKKRKGRDGRTFDELGKAFAKPMEQE
jgi:hypothetical protein